MASSVYVNVNVERQTAKRWPEGGRKRARRQAATGSAGHDVGTLRSTGPAVGSTVSAHCTVDRRLLDAATNDASSRNPAPRWPAAASNLVPAFASGASQSRSYVVVRSTNIKESAGEACRLVPACKPLQHAPAWLCAVPCCSGWRPGAEVTDVCLECSTVPQGAWHRRRSHTAAKACQATIAADSVNEHGAAVCTHG
ncbi:hypothetical protein BDV95DRAFT_590078 [Massariosphaeria phaeospora]|uniref:Uncharacterized protein n=1 Tax=Massariosphaeria phaeospora TaxID=100035 RepID=A0A7C8MFY4_9PLEO|nr:hypothetical protein BDV95DRAFT_590078 [Massariosphaeria phaeospora]